jgi:cellulose synthase/poly-beta-1,6-N-acetylglucosamine synthase-like glycosyltransferase
MSGKDNFESLPLIKYNFKVDKTLEEEQKRVETEEYERINLVHKLSEITTEIPMCVVLPSYNNNAKFRIEYNLNSVFNQNYTNYLAVIINDVSTDGSDEVYRKYLNFYNISKSVYAYR